MLAVKHVVRCIHIFYFHARVVMDFLQAVKSGGGGGGGDFATNSSGKFFVLCKMRREVDSFHFRGSPTPW